MNIYKLKIFKTKDIGVEINSMLGGDDLFILNMICRQINDNRTNILCNLYYIIIRVHSAFSLVASCVSLKYTRTDDVN